MSKRNVDAVQIPGDQLDALGVDQNAIESVEVADLKGQIAQRDALIAELQAKLKDIETVPSVPAALPERRLIGEDWSSKTSAEAKAAGVTHSVLCSDGYYIPG